MWVYRLICNINPVGTSMGVVALTPTICQRRSRSRIGCPKNKQIYVCWSCLPCNPSSNWTRVEILAYGNRLRSTHCMQFHHIKLCRPAYFVRSTQLLPHSGYEQWMKLLYFLYVNSSSMSGLIYAVKLRRKLETSHKIQQTLEAKYWLKELCVVYRGENGITK